MIEVSVAIIEERERFLIGRRAEGDGCSGLWEFPGGKRRPGETAEACLRRECREELGIEIAVGEPMHKMRWRSATSDILFVFFRARIEAGRPTQNAAIHTALSWASREAFAQYAFCPADMEFIRLCLPRPPCWPKR